MVQPSLVISQLALEFIIATQLVLIIYLTQPKERGNSEQRSGLDDLSQPLGGMKFHVDDDENL